ncbi:MAG: iron ABC transporter permease [Planctomycetota bacterium]
MSTRSRSVTACAVLGVVTVLAVALRLAIGESGFALPTRADVWSIRASRALTGVGVGSALGVAGMLLQAMLRNPLASPFLLGLTSGAGLGVVVATYAAFLATGSVALAGPPIGAVLVGSFGALGLVYALSQRRGVPEPTHLVLVGVIVSVVCAALTTFIQQLMPDRGMAVFTRWMMGAISDETYGAQLWLVCALIGACVCWAVTLGDQLDAAALSDDEARSVGVALGRLRALCVLIAGLLTAGSVLLAGPVGFVGLIAPHLARRLAGPGHRWGIVASAMCGASLVVLADAGVAFIRTPAGRMPIGVLTSMVGGVLFLWLLRKERAL